MNRRDEILKLFSGVDKDTMLIISPSIDEMIFLEEQLEEVKKKPFIKFHPTDPTKQKILPAQRTYISLLQQYNIVVKNIHSMIGKDTEDRGVSPLREYLEKINGKR